MLDYGNPPAWPDRVVQLVRAVHVTGSIAGGTLESVFMPTKSEAMFGYIADQAVALKLLQRTGTGAEATYAPVTGLFTETPPAQAVFDRAHQVLVGKTGAPDLKTLDICAVSVILPDRPTRESRERGGVLIEDLAEAVGGIKHHFNADQALFWIRWCSALGVGCAIARKRGKKEERVFIPYPVERIRQSLGDVFGKKTELMMGDFRSRLAEHMPYLDGGEAFMRVAQALEVRIAPPRLSSILAAALVELEDQKVLKSERSPPSSRTDWRAGEGRRA